MNDLLLVRPDGSMKDAFLRFNGEWEKNGEKVVPYAARRRGMTFEDWLAETRAMEQHAPEGMVTATLWFLVSGERILGAITLRHELNDYLMGVGGHIGYGVRPSERGRGYAHDMLQRVLREAKDRGMDSVLLTCNKSNPSSERTILKSGGVLEDEKVDGDEVVARYWITL